ncbi:MAG: hypothetical protein ABI175_30410 [Polyangiales bacterium]
MDRDRFEAEVVALASDGVPVTVANVAARTRLPMRKAESMLDDMLRGGHLDSDIDESEGVIVYRVKGLTARKGRTRVAVSDLDDLQSRAMRSAGEVLVKQTASRAKKAILAKPEEGKKSILYGALWGLLGPIGLAYSAPWLTVLLSTVVYAVLWKIPIVSSILGALFIFIHLATGLLGAAFAFRYNQTGQRSSLLPPEENKKLPR